jgi:protein involved in polysaccharide export with SLBB domain
LLCNNTYSGIFISNCYIDGFEKEGGIQLNTNGLYILKFSREPPVGWACKFKTPFGRRYSSRRLWPGLLSLFLYLALVPLEAQDRGSALVIPNTAAVDSRLLLALSTADYPATPGDVYNLSFSPMAGNPIGIQLVLDARYQLKVLNLGNVNARGKTYIQLKTEVENLVSRNYPLSGPSLTLYRIGEFTVTVTGETLLPGNRTVDGLTRVSAMLTDLTGKASIRFVQIASANETVRLYDTFIATRTGNFSHDPYIRPGDRVYIPKAGRIVQVTGEVFRQGRYELLSDEGLLELVEKYGGGLTAEAVPGKMSIARLDSPSVPTRSFINLSWDTRRNVSLVDGDLVTVPNKDGDRQAVFFEGAVVTGGEDDESGDAAAAKALPRIPYYLYPGETVGNASRNVRQIFTEVSDLAQAYILRDGSRMPVNLERFLFRNDEFNGIPLRGGDVIVIPFRRYYTITGEVAEAGDRPLTSLTRLSALLTGLSAKASSRFVTVTPAGGLPETYDLFQSRRFGDLAHDPYIRPGDSIQVPAAGYKVAITGEVFRPGEYEILPGETLKDIIEYYADGFTLDAVPEKITLSRAGEDTATSRETLYLAWSRDVAFALTDGDRIDIGNKDSNRQAVFFEGAVFNNIVDNEGTMPNTADSNTSTVSRIPYYFSSGETLAKAGRAVREHFSEASDLSRAYILRDGSRMPMDMEPYLFHNDDSADIPLQSGDVIVIPFRRYYTITGEVVEAGDRPLTSLTRLSALLTGLSAKASSRFVSVTPAGGSPETYDLFQSRRFGNLSQDPYIRPGDSIRVPVAGRKVTITGEVFRPGEYELLPGETLKDLIGYYADGFTLDADPDRIDLVRINTTEHIPGESKLFSYKENESMILEDRDTVSVGNKIENRPIAFFIGAISTVIEESIEQTTTDIEGTTLMEYPFYEGATLGNVVRAIRNRFVVASDLANAYLVRENRIIPCALDRFLYQQDFSNDIVLENGDTIIIPFRQYFVLVSGAVKTPGRYPYVPDRTADYYINLAGGRDDLLNNGRGIHIMDINNRKIPDTSLISPETMITVPTNRLTARFNQYGPVITTILSIVSTTLSILAVSGIFN